MERRGLNCPTYEKGMTSILNSFLNHPNIVNNLKILDFSYNPMEPSTCDLFLKVLGEMGRKANLETLNVTSTGLNICLLFNAVSEFVSFFSCAF
jgi:hypothetical protein